MKTCPFQFPLNTPQSIEAIFEDFQMSRHCSQMQQSSCGENESFSKVISNKKGRQRAFYYSKTSCIWPDYLCTQNENFLPIVLRSE